MPRCLFSGMDLRQTPAQQLEDRRLRHRENQRQQVLQHRGAQRRLNFADDPIHTIVTAGKSPVADDAWEIFTSSPVSRYGV